MERIVIEVDEKLAKAWKRASERKRKEIGNKLNISLAKDLMSSDLNKMNKNSTEYHEFLDELRNNMASKGLSQTELEEILNDV
ncbi:MAG: hypothetical protein AB7S72_09745 [Draconibacterium sp.]